MAAPANLEKYSFKDAKRDFDNARQQIVPEGWEVFVDTDIKGDILKVWRKADAATGLYLYKVVGTIHNADLEDFVAVVNNFDYRCSWDTYTASLSVVEAVDGIALDDSEPEKKSDGGSIVQWRVKFGLPMVSDREYLFYRHLARIDGTVIIMDRQCPLQDKYPPKKALTRVEGYNNAICLKQEGDAVVMGQDYLTALDLRMSLPTWLLNWAAGAGVKGVIKLYKDALAGYPAWKQKNGK